MRLDTRKKRLLKKNIQTLSLTGGGGLTRVMTLYEDARDKASAKLAAIRALREGEGK